MEKVKCTNCGSENTSKAKYCSDCGYELPKQLIVIEEPVIEQKPVKNNTNKKTLGTLIGIIAFAVAYIAVQQFFFKNVSIDKEMMKLASEINKSCPVMIDAETRLDNTIGMTNRVFQYNYTLVNIEKATTDTMAMKNYLEPMIINLVRSNPQMKYQRDNKWTLNYNYKDKAGIYLFMLSITPDKYKE
jgi:hypothetical protein